MLKRMLHLIVFALCGAATSALCAVRFMPRTKARWNLSIVKVLAASAALLVAPVCYARGPIVRTMWESYDEYGLEGLFWAVVVVAVVIYFWWAHENEKIKKRIAWEEKRRQRKLEENKAAEQKKIEDRRAAKAAARRLRKNEKVKVYIPNMGGFTDVEVIKVLVKVGDDIEADTPLAVLEFSTRRSDNDVEVSATLAMLEPDEATLDVPSPADGTVTAIHVKVGDKVSKGALLAELAA